MLLVVEQEAGGEVPEEFLAKLDYLGRVYYVLREGTPFSGKVIGALEESLADLLLGEGLRLAVDALKRGDPPEEIFRILLFRQEPPPVKSVGAFDFEPEAVGRDRRDEISRELEVRFVNVDPRSESPRGEVVTEKLRIGIDLQGRKLRYEVTSLHRIERGREEMNDREVIGKAAILLYSVWKELRASIGESWDEQA